jgi:hypothetical protein
MTKPIPAAADALIKIHLTYLAVSDFRRRNVFPMLREELASRRYGNYFHFFVTLNLVKQVKADVEEQYKLPTTTGGMRHCYNAVIWEMGDIIRAPQIAEEKRQREIKARQDFKEKAFKGVRAGLSFAKSYLFEIDGYRFDDETLCDFERVAAELEDIVRNGEIRSESDGDEEIAANDSSSVRKSDIPLQNFLRSVTSDLSLVENERPEGE